MTKYKWFLIIGLTLLIIGTILALVFSLKTWNRMKVTARTSAQTTTAPSITPTPDPNQPFSIALLGYGGGNHEGGLLTDSIMVVKINPQTQVINLISVPRDLWVPLPINGQTTKMFKINAAYAIGADDKKYPQKLREFTGPAGGGQLAKSILSQILGFQVNYFIALDFAGFQKVVDKLGGVTVKIEQPFDDPFYPLDTGTTDTCGKSDTEITALSATLSGDKLEQSFLCRYETLHFSVGSTQMDGATALKFVRSRHAAIGGGDFARAARQRLIIESVKNKVFSIGFLPQIIPTIQTLSYHLTHDLDIPTIQKILNRALEFGGYQINTVALTDQNVLKNTKSLDGQYVLTPLAGEANWSQIQSYLATTSATPK